MERGLTLHTSWRSTVVALEPDRAWQVVASGERGPQWYADAAPLRWRGTIDRLLGGPARRPPPPGRPLLRAEDRAGLWEVVTADQQRRELVLRARVGAPGEVRLDATVTPAGGGSRVRLAVTFRPTGLLGRGYLVADVPAREAVVELTLRHLRQALRTAAG